MFTDCEDCEEIYDGDCPIHGPLRCLDHGAGWDEDSKAYTTVPVPAQLTVKTSDIISAGGDIMIIMLLNTNMCLPTPILPATKNCHCIAGNIDGH